MPEDLVSLGFKFVSKISVVFNDFDSELAAKLGPENSEIGERGGSLNWIDSVSKHVGGRVVLEILDNNGISAAYETDVGAEALASCTDQEDIRPVFKFLNLPGA